jgi:hypothetical protein
MKRSSVIFKKNKRMNGYEKYKNTCTSIYFAWTRSSIYKNIPKELMLMCIRFLKIDLQWYQSFPNMAKDIVGYAIGYHPSLQVDPNSFRLAKRANSYVWNYYSVNLDNFKEHDFFIQCCESCMAPVKYEIALIGDVLDDGIQVTEPSTWKQTCVNGHVRLSHLLSREIPMLRRKFIINV